MFSSYSANEENKTFDELSGEECYEVISVPIWDFLWSLIIFLHFVVLGNIIYNVREGLGDGFISDWWQNFIPRNIQWSPWETWLENCVSSLITLHLCHNCWSACSLTHFTAKSSNIKRILFLISGIWFISCCFKLSKVVVLVLFFAPHAKAIHINNLSRPNFNLIPLSSCVIVVKSGWEVKRKRTTRFQIFESKNFHRYL